MRLFVYCFSATTKSTKPIFMKFCRLNKHLSNKKHFSDFFCKYTDVLLCPVYCVYRLSPRCHRAAAAGIITSVLSSSSAAWCSGNPLFRYWKLLRADAFIVAWFSRAGVGRRCRPGARDWVLFIHSEFSPQNWFFVLVPVRWTKTRESEKKHRTTTIDCRNKKPWMEGVMEQKFSIQYPSVCRYIASRFVGWRSPRSAKSVDKKILLSIIITDCYSCGKRYVGICSVAVYFRRYLFWSDTFASAGESVTWIELPHCSNWI